MRVNVLQTKSKAIHEELVNKGYQDIAKPFRTYEPIDGAVDLVKMPSAIDKTGLVAIRDAAKKHGARALQSLCSQLISLTDDINTKLSTVKQVEVALSLYLQEGLIDGWVYYDDGENGMLPHLITSIHYVPSDPENGIVEHVKIGMNYNTPKKTSYLGSRQRFEATKKTHIELNNQDVHGRTIFEAMYNAGYTHETQELKDNYNESLALYKKYINDFGKQFITTIRVNSKRNKYEGNNDWQRVKYIMDDQAQLIDFEMDEKCYLAAGIEQSDLAKADDSWLSFEKAKAFDRIVPFHPFLLMFSLNTHNNVYVIANHISPYQYNSELKKELILPQEHHDLIDILINDVDTLNTDIIEGKSGGTIILAMGRPGLGKTLSAEVYSEVTGKPLYRVHAGQLGTTPGEVTENIDLITDRATAWGALLLVDEADTYIRQRNDDMQHNAIVAILLQKFEYFNGLMFMTTNRVDDVDDGILSRCSAIISYEKPEQKSLFEFWESISKASGLEIEQTLINDIIAHTKDTTGRDIKKMIDLAKRFTANGKAELTLDLFRICAMFRKIKWVSPSN